MIKILIADDHEIIRTGLKKYIESILPHSEIDEAIDGDTAYEKIKHSIYNLMILDVNMPDTDSFGLINNIFAIRPDANILIFSMNAEDVYARKFMQLGVKGYISKASSTAEIGKAINNVLNNKHYISENLRNTFADEVLGKKKANPFDHFSSREFEIVQHLVRGESVGEISKTLNLHTSTIGTHKARKLKKMDCKNIIELNALAKVYKVVLDD